MVAAMRARRAISRLVHCWPIPTSAVSVERLNLCVASSDVLPESCLRERCA